MNDKVNINTEPQSSPDSHYSHISHDSQANRKQFHPDLYKEDFIQWAKDCVKIKPKGGGEDVDFVLNAPQRRLVAALEEMRRAEKPIRLILLKARQWGGSTCIQLYMAWLQIIHQEGLNSLIIAHQRCATDEIKDMFDRMIRQYPEKMLNPEGKPEWKKRTERVGGTTATTRLIPRNCKIKIGSAERPDSCRGADYNLVHCSEVGLWKSTAGKNAEDIHRAASSGILFEKNTMIVMESTANGTGNFFHREYMAAKEGKSQFKALFIPWFEIEKYTLPFEAGEKEKFERWLEENRHAQQPTDDRSQPGAYLWALRQKGASLEAIHWYVKERAKYSDHAMMAAEYPSDDVEAFAHSGSRVFDKYCVEALRADCSEVPLRGEIYGDAPTGPDSLKGLHFTPSSDGALLIWRDREEETYCRERVVKRRYVVAVDIGGRSAGADWSVITVFDRIGMIEGGKPEVAAQWRGHTDFDLLAWKAAQIAAYFDDALLVIESNTLETHSTGEGESSDHSEYLLTTLKHNYANLYVRRSNETKVGRERRTRYGFHTNRSTKPMIIATLVQIIREGSYIEHDARCLDEYLTYELRQNGSYGAIDGCHDDLLMTRAIGLYICFHDMEPPALELPDLPTRRPTSFNYAWQTSAAVF